MPAIAKKATIPRETVKTLAKAIGIRPAARQLGLDENLVLQWSKRDKEGPWSVKQVERNQTVLTPSKAIENVLREDGEQTRLSLSRNIRRGTEALERLPAEVIFTRADKVKALTGAASTVHAWEAKQQEAGVNLSILSISGDMAVQINQQSQQ